MTIKEFITALQKQGEESSYSAIAREIPCHVSYIEKIANGKRRPSYDMARRIEQVTNGRVSRYNWYPKD